MLSCHPLVRFSRNLKLHFVLHSFYFTKMTKTFLSCSAFSFAQRNFNILCRAFRDTIDYVETKLKKSRVFSCGLEYSEVVDIYQHSLLRVIVMQILLGWPRKSWHLDVIECFWDMRHNTWLAFCYSYYSVYSKHYISTIGHSIWSSNNTYQQET